MSTAVDYNRFRITYCAQTAGEMSGKVIFKVSTFEQIELDEVVKTKLTNCYRHSSCGSPLCSVEQFAWSFFSCYSDYSVKSVFVTAKKT